MDELVFLRETLRRELLDIAEMLEKAAAEYDPEDVVPTGDLLAALSGFQCVARHRAQVQRHGDPPHRGADREEGPAMTASPSPLDGVNATAAARSKAVHHQEGPNPSIRGP